MPDTNTKKKFWLTLFLLALLGDIIGILAGNETLQFFLKPLIIPSLIIYFFASVNRRNKILRNLIVSALFFSWVGDVLLMFQDEKALFFMLGLVSFLIAHLFYIAFFFKVKAIEQYKTSFPLLILVIAYYAGLIIWLTPFLGDMKIPVWVYGIVISTMLMLALHMHPIRTGHAGMLMVVGAVLFVISDSVLAVNKFYSSFKWAGVIIMLTYGFAQLFIVKGAYIYLQDERK